MLGFHKLLSFLIGTLCCLSLVGCQSIEEKPADDILTENVYEEPTEQSTYKDLSSSVGSPTNIEDLPTDFPLEINDPTYFSDGETPTGKWIMTDGEGRFGYTIPSGVVEAGSFIEIGLIHTSDENNELARNVRVQIRPCTDEHQCEEPIIEKEEFVSEIEDDFILYEGFVPATMNRLYRVSLEVIHEDTIEDTLISYMYVPENSLNASIELDEKEDQILTFVLTNYGPTTLTTGEDFSIEQLIDGKWLIVPYQNMVKDIAYILYPGDHSSFTVDTSTFPNGSYRFVKQLHGNPYGLQDAIAAPFSVIDD